MKVTKKVVDDYFTKNGLTRKDMHIPNYGDINPFLVYQQKLNKKRVLAITDLHIKRLDVFQKMKVSDDIIELRQLAAEVTQIDFSLQNEWGLPRDESLHEWWYKVPKCSCPKMDNEERRGFYNIYSSDCIIHGNKVIKKNGQGNT